MCKIYVKMHLHWYRKLNFKLLSAFVFTSFFMSILNTSGVVVQLFCSIYTMKVRGKKE